MFRRFLLLVMCLNYLPKCNGKKVLVNTENGKSYLVELEDKEMYMKVGHYLNLFHSTQLTIVCLFRHFGVNLMLSWPHLE